MKQTKTIIGWIREIFLWCLAISPGLWIVYFGAAGIENQKLVGVMRARSTAYGEDAVGWGWVFIAIGTWALGQGLYLKTENPVWKRIGLGLACVPFGIGLIVLSGQAVSWFSS